MTPSNVNAPRPLRSRGPLHVLALLISLAPTVHAQRAVPTVELGGSLVRYADSVGTSAATISPSVRVDADRFTLGAGGTLSQSAAGWATQGSTHTSLFIPLAGALLAELGGSAGGSTHEDGARTGEVQGVMRAHLMTPQRGAWVGAGAGTTWDGFAWRPVRIGDVGVWTYVGTTTALATVSPTVVADTIRYTDAELALRFDLARAEIGIAGGARAGDRLPTIGGSSRGWGSLSVTGWLAPHAAVVASVGTYAVDFAQGFPGGRFVSLGIRFGPRTSHRDPATDAAGTLAAIASASSTPAGVTEESVLALRMGEAGSGNARVIRVLAPRATTVELAGDFTRWEPVRLRSAGGGWWTVTLPIDAGMHQVNVRANGRAWTVPPGLTSLDDEFGGVVGVLVVP